MNNYQRSWSNNQGPRIEHYSKHTHVYHWKSVLVIGVFVLVGLFVALKVATWDGCKVYYGYECLVIK